MQTVTISFFRFEGLRDRAWAFAQMQYARAALRATPGVGFVKQCGTGTGEGFTPRPNLGVYTILATWPDPARAEAATWEAPVFDAYRTRAAESWTVFMRPTRATGRWAGVAPFDAQPAERETPEPLAVLTRATVKLKHVARFWRRVPRISDAIGANQDVLFKIGMGERPWTNQVTFSIWPDRPSMAAFAHAAGPHKSAVEQVRAGDWFNEELYARFEVSGWRGQWLGRPPLPHPALERPV